MIPHVFAALVEPPLFCARITADHRSSYVIQTEQGYFQAGLKGSFRFEATNPADLPVAGDYVVVAAQDSSFTIQRLLPRTNLFARRAIDGSHDLQPIAANLDRLFLTIALNRDFNLRRLERYILAAAAYDVPFGIVLTKIDLVDDLSFYSRLASDIAGGAPILSVCAVDGRGMESFDSFRGANRTLAFVGSSGAGKSTLVNALSGEQLQQVQEIRKADERGKHTTTSRAIFYLPDGTAIIDTPGMREFALADAAEGVGLAFEEISALSRLCRFHDCQHQSEPGCAVRDNIDGDRLASFRKLEREAAFQSRKNDAVAAAAEKARWKAIHKANRRRNRYD